MIFIFFGLTNSSKRIYGSLHHRLSLDFRMATLMKKFYTDTGDRESEHRELTFVRSMNKWEVFANGETYAKKLGYDTFIVVLTSATSQYPGKWYVKVGYDYEDALRILEDNQRQGLHSRRICYLIKCSS